MSIVCDSRFIKPGDTFLVMPGGEMYIEEARQKGATILFHPYARRFWSSYAKAIYPKQPEICVAVTGTNGKTSVVSMLRQIWTYLGYKAASFGTLGIQGVMIDHPLPYLTTLDAMDFYKLLHSLSDDITHFAFEASSHGIEQDRVYDVKLNAACFTNLTQDHLDYHHTMESYFKAKEKLFTQLSPKHSVVNSDDPYGLRLPSTFTYGLKNKADLSFQKEDHWNLIYLGKKYPLASLPFSMSFQLYNLLAAIGLALVTGSEIEDILSVIEKMQAARGRFEHVLNFHGADVYVDFAHTPDALENVLRSARLITKGDLWVVFGCGGDRDNSKRPLMGKIASELADHVIVTDDNPRFEDPSLIRSHILKGCFGHVYEIEDRKHAIAFALSKIKPSDVLVIAGKGHETSQIIRNVYHPFCDKSVVQELSSTLVK